MTDAPLSGESFRIGRVLSRAFGAVGANALVFFTLAFLFAALPEVLFGLVRVFVTGPDMDPASALRGIPGENIAVALLGLVLQSALIHGMINHLGGRPVTVGECLSTGAKNFGQVWGVGFLTALGIIAGTIALIIPGIFLAVMWSVAVPAQVVEKKGVQASIGRSAELTKGHRWAIFVIGLIVAVIYVVIALGTGAAAVFLEPYARVGMMISELALTPLATMLLSLMGAVVGASLYYELRTIKDGTGPEELAAVFD